MISGTIIIVSLVALSFLVWNLIKSGPHHAADIWSAHTRESEIDIDVLSLLLSREENKYLCKSLPSHEFRSIRRQRISLARKYLKAINRSTGNLIRAAEAARLSGDRDVAQVADELLLIAFRVRLNVPLVHICLFAECLFPTLTLASPLKMGAYREMIGRVAFILQKVEAAH
jgi:hypothetical protein